MNRCANLLRSYRAPSRRRRRRQPHCASQAVNGSDDQRQDVRPSPTPRMPIGEMTEGQGCQAGVRRVRTARHYRATTSRSATHFLREQAPDSQGVCKRASLTQDRIPGIDPEHASPTRVAGTASTLRLGPWLHGQASRRTNINDDLIDHSPRPPSR